MQLSHRGVADPSQRWVLHELIRYLQHPRSGASGFEDMGPGWVPVREAVVAGTLRPSDRKALAVAESWDRLLRQVCLQQSGALGVEVTPVGARRSATDPTARASQHVKSLVEQGILTAALRIPGAVGPLNYTANLRTGQVEASVELAAPPGRSSPHPSQLGAATTSRGPRVASRSSRSPDGWPMIDASCWMPPARTRDCCSLVEICATAG